MRKGRAHATNVVLFATSVGLGAGAYAGLLPARMGVLPPVAVLTVVLYYGAAWWMQRYPSTLNMPNQTVYDTLPEEDKQRAIACMLPFCYWSVALWTGYGIVAMSFNTPAVYVVGLVLAGIAEGALAIRFPLLKASRKVRELQETTQNRSG